MTDSRDWWFTTDLWPAKKRRMKLPPIVTLLVLSIFSALTACNKTPDEKTAIATFKDEIETVGKWVEEKQKSAKTAPEAVIPMIREMAAKFKVIKTDGLPTDLKAAWGEMSSAMTEMAELYKGTPPSNPQKPEEDAAKKMQDEVAKLAAASK
mgnify:FL=1